MVGEAVASGIEPRRAHRAAEVPDAVVEGAILPVGQIAVYHRRTLQQRGCHQMQTDVPRDRSFGCGALRHQQASDQEHSKTHRFQCTLEVQPMLPNFLFPEAEVQKDGEGLAVPVEDAAGQTLQLTLGVTDITEQSSLDVMVFGSADGAAWSAKPLVSYPQKFYKGVYTMLLDLSEAPETRHLKVKYKAARWGHWTTPPTVNFYVFAEQLKA